MLLSALKHSTLKGMKSKASLKSIPPLVLVLLLVATSIAAAFVVQTVTSSSTVAESISTSQSNFSASIFPGQSTTFTVDVTNAAAVVYGMTYTFTPTGPAGTTFTATLSVEGGAPAAYTSGTKVTILATHTLVITATSALDGATGAISVSVAVDRGTPA